jgi:PAS domain-containing protein
MALVPVDGAVVGILGTYQDITERKRTDEELARHRNQLEERVAERTAELRQAMEQLLQAEKLADAPDASPTAVGTGKLLHVHLVCYPNVEHGRLVGSFAIYRDITDRKRAEEHLLFSNALLAAEQAALDRRYSGG